MRRSHLGLVLINVAFAMLLAGRGHQGKARGAGGEAVAFVDQRIAAMDLTPAERRWESIGWIYDIDRASQIARETHRPILAYVVNGRLDGRC